MTSLAIHLTHQFFHTNTYTSHNRFVDSRLTQIMCTAALFLSLKLNDMHMPAQEFCAAHYSVMNKIQQHKNPPPLCPQTTHAIREELCMAESRLLKCVGFGIGVNVDAYRLLDEIIRSTNPIEGETKNVLALARLVLLEIFRSGCSLFFRQGSLAFAAYLMAFKLHTGFASPEHWRRSGAVSRMKRRNQQAQAPEHKEGSQQGCTAELPVGRKRWEPKTAITKPQTPPEEVSDMMLGKRTLVSDKEPTPETTKLLDFTQEPAIGGEPGLEPEAVPIFLPHLPVTHPNLQEPESVNQPRVLHAPLVPANSPMDEPQSSVEPCGPEDTLVGDEKETNIHQNRSSQERTDNVENVKTTTEGAQTNKACKLDRLRGLKSFLEDKEANKPAAHPATQCPELFPLGLRLDNQAPTENRVLAEPAKADGRSNQSTNATPQMVPTLEFIICPSEPLVRIDQAGGHTQSAGQIDDEECFKRFLGDFSSRLTNPVEIFEVMSITTESIKQKLYRKTITQAGSNGQPSHNRGLLQSLCSRTHVATTHKEDLPRE